MTVGTTFPCKILNNGKEPCEPLMTSSYASLLVFHKKLNQTSEASQKKYSYENALNDNDSFIY
jgi:hypothetical protein